MQLGRIAGSCSSAEDSQTTIRSLPGMARPSALRSVVLPLETRPATTMFLPARTQAVRKAAASSLRKSSSTSSASVPAPSRKRRIVQIGCPFEETFEEGAHLAVVVEGELGDAFEPLAGVAEDALGPVDHPFLRERVGEHPFGDRAQSDQVVAKFVRELFAFVACEFALLPVEGVGLVAAQDFFDQRLRARPSLFAGEVDFLGGERALDAHAHEFTRVGYDLRHGSATSSVCSFGAGGMSMRLRSRGSGATGRNSCSSSRASVRV